MPFKSLLTPASDETFSSWAYRCSVSRFLGNLDRRALGREPSWRLCGARIDVEDPDYDIASEYMRGATNTLGVHSRILERYFLAAADNAVGWNARRYFCPLCLRNDVALGRMPSWRNEWCKKTAVMCLTHCCYLVELRSSPGISKAWDAFSELSNDLSDFYIDKNTQKYHFLLYRRISMLLKSTGSTSSTHEIEASELLRNLYSLFLQSPYRGCRGGSARLFFNARRGVTADADSFIVSCTYGLETADLRSRLVSLVISAMLLDLIPANAALLLNKQNNTGINFWPITEDIRRRFFLPAVDSKSYEDLRVYLGRFTRERWPKLDRFLEFEEQKYRQMGVHSGRKLGA